MDRDILLAIRGLLTGTRILSLAVLVDGAPEASLMPFATADDFAAVYVQASGLARHARGLQNGAPAGVLVHAGDSAAGDPMQIARLSVAATVAVLDRTGDRFAPAAARFAARLPGAALTLSLPDFQLYELTLGRGRYVEGFARAFNVGPETFADVARL
jgi:putative heme iron utilization protein